MRKKNNENDEELKRLQDQYRELQQNFQDM